MASATQLPPRPCHRSRFRILSSAVRGPGVGAIAFNARACAFSSSALLRFRHTQENPFALLISLASRQVAIYLRRLHFGAPVPFDHFDRLLSIFRVTRLILAAHNLLELIGWLHRSANGWLRPRS